MTQDAVGTNDIPDVIPTRTMKSGDVQQSKGLVTVTLTPSTYNGPDATEQIRRLFPQAQHIIEKSTATGLDGAPYVYEVQRFRCTYPTIAHAREACYKFGNLTTIWIEAPITLHEEQFEVLAEYHANRVLGLEWFARSNYDHQDAWDLKYHYGQLNELGHVLGHEAVQRIFDETRKKAGWRAEQATALISRTDITSVRESSG